MPISRKPRQATGTGKEQSPKGKAGSDRLVHIGASQGDLPSLHGEEE